MIKNLHKLLLGRPAITALKLLDRISSVEEREKSVIEQFPSVFKGLGKLEGEYTIKLQDNVKPFAITTPRQVPIPLLNPVKKELDRMEEMGIISTIQEPTDWCAGMVPVQKKNGQIRICVNLTQINESVMREIYTPYQQLSIHWHNWLEFSKLGVNSEFYQIPLDPKSSKLTIS